MINNKAVQEQIDIVAQEMDLPKEVVTVAYRSFWEFMRDTLREYPKYYNITEEEFNNLKVNFNLPSIGKLYTTWDKIEIKKKKYNETKNKED